MSNVQQYLFVVYTFQEELSTDGDGSAWVERMTRLSLPGSQRWAILMMSGGHFAGAIFSGKPLRLQWLRCQKCVKNAVFKDFFH